MYPGHHKPLRFTAYAPSRKVILRWSGNFEKEILLTVLHSASVCGGDQCARDQTWSEPRESALAAAGLGLW